MFSWTLALFPREGIVLRMTLARGQHRRTSDTSRSYSWITWPAGTRSASLPPHCNTIRSGGFCFETIFWILLRIYGISRPGYVNVFALLPRLLSLEPSPLTNDVPTTRVVGRLSVTVWYTLSYGCPSRRRWDVASDCVVVVVVRWATEWSCRWRPLGLFPFVALRLHAPA